MREEDKGVVKWLLFCANYLEMLVYHTNPPAVPLLPLLFFSLSPYLQTQIGNPDGADKPNKKYYDPRECLRAAEVNTVDRLTKAFSDLNCQNILGLGPPEEPENTLGPRRGGLPV